MARYIHERKEWTVFRWDTARVAMLLADIRHRQGRLIGRMEALGFNLRDEAILNTLTLDILPAYEIEGEMLNPAQVRSSIARRLGMEIAGLVPADRHVDGVVEMMLDATQKYNEPLTDKRMFGWHAAMFPSGYSGMYKIMVGNWRNSPMHVVSGAMGKEKIHFEAPDAALLEEEMSQFVRWFNALTPIDPVIKAGIAHLWFITIHPFEDGNGRIARTITDMLLARADGTAQRFYSMSAQIQKERNAYYNILETTQKGTRDITDWLHWFLSCLGRALIATEYTLAAVLKKARFWDTHAQTQLSARQTLMLNKLLDGFEGNLTSGKWATIAKCSQDTALRDIQELIEQGILTKQNAGGRSTHYTITE